MTKIDVSITVATDFMTASDDVSQECGAAHGIRSDQKKGLVAVSGGWGNA